MDKIIDKINTYNDETIYIYSAIIFFSMVYFSRYNIGINVVFGFFIGIIIINIILKQKIDTDENRREDLKTKISVIKPKLNTLQKRDDIVDYLFSIQELYYYNPQAYSEMVQLLEDFYRLEDLVSIGELNFGLYYDLLQDKKRLILNNLQSLIILTPEDKRIDLKLEMACDILEDKLNKTLDKVYYMYKENIHKNGYNTDIKLLSPLSPDGSNKFDDVFDQRFSNMFELY
jgi:hypothetical protein